MKKLLLALLLGISSPALAQVNTVPQVGLITSVLRNPTYSAVSVGLVPAASATDIFCISGSATKSVAVRQIVISGTAGTAITTPVVLLRRVALDTGGTAATGLALPVAATNSSGDTAATAVLTAYTANPTINDSSPSLLQGPAVSFATTTTANQPTILKSGTQVDLFTKGWDLHGAAQQLCLNLNGASVSSGVLALSIQWTEQ